MTILYQPGHGFHETTCSRQMDRQWRDSGHPSAEQLQRMEENRRKARAKLAAKRAHPQASLDHGGRSLSIQEQPPPAKRPAYITAPQPTRSEPSNSSNRPTSKPNQSGKIIYAHNRPPQPQRSNHPSTTSHHSVNSSSSKPVPTSMQHLAGHLAKPQDPVNHKSTSSHNSVSSSTTAVSGYQQSTHYSKPSTSHGPVDRTAQNASIKTAASSFKAPIKPSSTSHHPPPVKCAQLKEKKKAKVYLISKTRFEVSVQYDGVLIEMFKKMHTRAYSKFI